MTMWFLKVNYNNVHWIGLIKLTPVKEHGGVEKQKRRAYYGCVMLAIGTSFLLPCATAKLSDRNAMSSEKWPQNINEIELEIQTFLQESL